MEIIKVICRQDNSHVLTTVKGEFFTANMEPIMGLTGQLEIFSSTYEWLKRDVKNSVPHSQILRKLYPQGYWFEFEYQTI